MRFSLSLPLITSFFDQGLPNLEPINPLCLPTEQRTTQQGQVYFLHTQTGVSTWHDPRVPRYVRHGIRVMKTTLRKWPVHRCLNQSSSFVILYSPPEPTTTDMPDVTRSPCHSSRLVLVPLLFAINLLLIMSLTCLEKTHVALL